MSIVGIPAIVIISYLVTEGFKQFVKKKYLPTIAGLTGAIFGLLAYFFAPNLIPTADIITSIAVGIVSGLASTGSDQLVKKLIEKEVKVENE